MRRIGRISGTAGGLVVLIVVLAAAMAGAGHPAARAQGGAPPPCSVEKVAAPDVVPLGYSTRVTLTVHTQCALSDTVPTHTVLVIDGSGSMTSRLGDLKPVLQAFVTALDLPGHPDDQVAVVKYNSVASTLCQLTNDTSRLQGCIRKLTAEGGSVIDAGVREGLRALMQGRSRGAPSNSREVMILTTDGSNNAGCGPVRAATGQAKGQRVVMATVAMGDDSDADCMRQAASPGMAYVARTQPEMIAAFQSLASLVSRPMVSGLTVRDTVPPNMRLEPGTVKPAALIDAAGLLTWEWGPGPVGDYVMTYAVTPLELGDHPVNVAAESDLETITRHVVLAFPVPRVRVVDSAGLPTPTPFPTPTPGGAPTPQPTLWPTPAPTAAPTATRVPGTAFACPGLERLAPAQAVADALANPARVSGFGQRCRPSLPPGPLNPLRSALGLQTAGKPYHPVFNGLQYKCGCP